LCFFRILVNEEVKKKTPLSEPFRVYIDGCFVCLLLGSVTDNVNSLKKERKAHISQGSHQFMSAHQDLATQSFWLGKTKMQFIL
jgi:hypothetical protein